MDGRTVGRHRVAWRAAGAVVLGISACSASAQYSRRDLVSDGFIPAEHTDPNLVNAWGIAFNPNPNGVAWVANAGTGTSTLYDGDGNPKPLVVSVPAPGGGPGSPTGLAFNASSEFLINNGGGLAPSVFLFATEDGTIAGWNTGDSTHAILAVDNSGRDAIYKGMEFANTGSGARLYAADFHNGRVDRFDGSFGEIGGNAFVDPGLPAGYAPFNIADIGGHLFVSYALQDADGEDDIPGIGHGYISEFDTDGSFMRRFASQGELDSPWGMALAPSDFGPFSGDLLVGNFGDGTINAFDLATGTWEGRLSDAHGVPIAIDGLWGLEFGNGFNNQPTNTLFFAAGPDLEQHGLYGRIDLVPAPGTAVLLGFMLVQRRRR